MSNKNIMIRLSDAHHMKLKLHSVKIGVPMQRIFLEALAKILKSFE